MAELETLAVEERDGIIHLTLRRPEVHNAFNDQVIAEMIDLFEGPFPRSGARAIVLGGTGPNFCAGADLNWMARMIDYSREENIRDSSALAKMFALMNESSLPIVGRIQGAAIGGGVGLVSICDIAIAEEKSTFGLAEVKLGILPAVISPYVIAKIGEGHARALFLTGERFGAARAHQIGLVHHIVSGQEELDRAVDEAIRQLRSSGPGAVEACKALIRYVADHELMDAVPYTIEAIAERRVSEEGQGGMKAFLNKEKPPWDRA
ncbi:MAG TPA: enoyl-CoA hydratase-related protein [Thermoanaerobaculia bacterium]|nr:enoyl-CoA hydratase-related protein [Thermoanaerobaculia bacterium]